MCTEGLFKVRMTVTTSNGGPNVNYLAVGIGVGTLKVPFLTNDDADAGAEKVLFFGCFVVS